MVELSDIQPIALESPSLGVPESNDIQEVVMKLVENNLSEDVWRVPYIEYLFNQVLPKGPKLQGKVQRDTV